MFHVMEENEAGRYEVISDEQGITNPDGRFYYRAYIPSSLMQLDVSRFQANDVINGCLNRIYREIGMQQGLGFRECNYSGKNRQLYKQEIIALLESKDGQVSLTDIFCKWMPDEIRKSLSFYECMENEDDLMVQKILCGKIYQGNEQLSFRKEQIWEETRIKKVSIRGYNPTAPKHIPELMQDLERYRREDNGIDPVIKVGLLCYQFLTIMPYEENNEVWASMLLNCSFREQGMGTDYYVPFARYLLEQETERKYVMQQVRETGEYDVWICFFLKILELAYMRTNQMLMQLEQIHKDTVYAISGEKQKAFLQNVMIFIEDNPIFGIGDIEKELHAAYNTAAKSVAILESYGLVRKMSHKQRYRIYAYEKYLQEILK